MIRQRGRGWKWGRMGQCETARDKMRGKNGQDRLQPCKQEERTGIVS